MPKEPKDIFEFELSPGVLEKQLAEGANESVNASTLAAVYELDTGADRVSEGKHLTQGSNSIYFFMQIRPGK